MVGVGGSGWANGQYRYLVGGRSGGHDRQGRGWYGGLVGRPNDEGNLAGKQAGRPAGWSLVRRCRVREGGRTAETCYVEGQRKQAGMYSASGGGS